MGTAKLIYLAGPIYGCTHGEAKDWRRHVIDEIEHRSGGELIGLDPLRCEPVIGTRYGMHYDDRLFGTKDAIFGKNMADVRRCDAVLAYFPQDAATVSLGTVGEMGVAYQAQKPVFLVSVDPRVIEHPVVTGFAGWHLDDLDQGIEAVLGVMCDKKPRANRWSWADNCLCIW